MKAFLISLAFLFMSACSEPSKPDLQSIAFTQAKQYIKATLNDPGSFDGGHSPESIVPMGDSTFIVNSHFSAKNGFGATITTKYNMTIHYTGGDAFEPTNWKVEELLIDGKQVK